MAESRPLAPLLTRGALREAARASLDELSRGLLAVPLRRSMARHGAGVGRGGAGLALAHAYLARAFPDRDHATAAGVALAAAMAMETSRELDPHFFNGLSGIGWVAEHLRDRDDEDPLGALDDALLAVVSRARWSGPAEIDVGLAGIALYALERMPSERASDILANVTRLLAKTAWRSDAGAAWISEPRWYAWKPKHLRPPRSVCLGVLSGGAGIVGVLAAIAGAGIERDVATELAREGARWLLSHERPDAVGFRGREYLGKQKPDDQERLALERGDLGVGVPLFLAARVLGDASIEKRARAAVDRAAAVVNPFIRPRDACIARGASGIAHAFHVMHGATGDANYARVARRWTEETLARRAPGRGVAGYRTFTALRQDPLLMGWRVEPGAITGVAGVALVLSSALDPSPAALAWSRAIYPATRR